MAFRRIFARANLNEFKPHQFPWQRDKGLRASNEESLFVLGFPSTKNRYFVSKSCYHAPSRLPALQPAFSTALNMLKLTVDAGGPTAYSRETLEHAIPTARRAAAVPTATTAPRQVIACLVHPFFTIGQHAQTARGGLAAVLRFVRRARLVSSCTVTCAV
jgi:hypothetical protein